MLLLCIQEVNAIRLFYCTYSLGQGWATPGTSTELGTRARFYGTRARPRKRGNGKDAAEVSLTNKRPFYLL